MPLQPTRVSSKGHVIVPRALREPKHWAPGTPVEVVDHPEGVLIRPLVPRPTGKKLAELYGMLRYGGPPRTIEEMAQAIDEAMTQKWAKLIASTREP